MKGLVKTFIVALLLASSAEAIQHKHKRHHHKNNDGNLVQRKESIAA